VRILIVDDSKTILHVLGTLLKELGYLNVVEAENVDRAKQHFTKNRPNLIISDWNMPGATGLDLLRFVKGNPETADIPFIMLTTDSDRNKIVEATRAGLQSYLLKPIKKTVLVDKLKELAAAYGFKPPLEHGQGGHQNVQEYGVSHQQKTSSDAQPLEGVIKKDQISAILDGYKKVWKSELSVSDFELFVKSTVFAGFPEDQTAILDGLLKTIQDAAREGVLNKLMQMVKPA
jgi:two-component system chemotaxis response regulator CheY